MKKNRIKLPLSRFKIVHIILILLIMLFFLPILIIIKQSITKLDNIESLSKDTSRKIVQEQTAQICKLEAQSLAKRISSFLYACEHDLHVLSQLQINPDSFLRFAENHNYRISLSKNQTPLYKEIAFINKDGQEIVKILNNQLVPDEQLKDISNPANTTYKTERYFEQTKTSQSNIWVSHLTGWYVSRQEQVEQGKSYSGVFRFCKKVLDDQGRFNGIFMIALDHQNIMEFIFEDQLSNKTLLTLYKSGNYNYIIDDEGWIIVHPKLWDIRGLDKNGNPLKPLTKETTKWELDSGFIPLNLKKMDWRLRDIYTDEPMSNIVRRVQRGETVVYTMKSSGIYKEYDAMVRTRACAPIFYNTGNYNKHGIWGGVVVGTAMENLIDKTNSFTAEVEKISRKANIYILILAAAISIIIMIFSSIITKATSKIITTLNNFLVKIAQGDFDIPVIESRVKEITDFSTGVKCLADDLKEKDKKIKTYIKDLKIMNIKLEDAQKELDSYWKHEYEIESIDILEEKIESYEKDYPRLNDIRQNLYVGNSPQFLKVLRQIVPLSQMTIPVWIHGETGVGKSALGYSMHKLSPRNEKVFHVFEAIEFSAADPMIVLGKLFGFGPGHGLRGINKNGQKGILEECHGGTLVIDDVDALPLDTQVQLLRVVDGLSFHPAAGKSKNITSDIRFIFVTNVDLEQRVKEGFFRKDLFRRMGGNINKIEIPPLRNRKSDIPLIIKYFIAEYNKKNKANLQIEEDALNILINYDYADGNIGELKMIVQLACERARLDGNSLIQKNSLPIANHNNNSGTDEIDDETLSNFFTKRECKELKILRRNSFNMGISEIELEYKKGSKTLSHHLRGICLKVLALNDWDVEKAIILIAENTDSIVKHQIQVRIEGYLKNIREKILTSNKNSLFKNLPKEYHTFLHQAFSKFQ